MKLKDLIYSTGGKIFTVCFQKRGSKEIRTMNCKLGVKPDGIATKPHINADAHHLVTVWSIEDKGYRSIPLEGVIWISIDGVKYHAVQSDMVPESV